MKSDRGTALHIIAAVSVLLATFAVAYCQTPSEQAGNLRQYRKGDIMIGGLIMVHSNRCSVLQDTGIQAIEAINLIIDQVNANNSILPNITLGTVMVDTCKSDTHALQQTVAEFLPYVSHLSPDACDANSKSVEPHRALFAGVIGASSSGVSIPTAKLLQIFSIPQVSYYSTSPELSDKETFKYFFRTVPPDNHQAKAIIDLVVYQGWNYISVVYENSLYGFHGYTEIEHAAKKKNICIAAKMAIDVHTKDHHHYEQAIQSLLERRKARVVVVFTGTLEARTLIQTAEKNPEAAGFFRWIGTDAWTKQIPRQDDNTYERALEGAIGFIPKSEQDIFGFNEYFTSLTLSQHYQHPKRDPWFAEYVSVKKNCSLKGSEDLGLRECRDDEQIEASTFRHLPHVQYVADAALAFVYALHEYHQNICGGKPGICPELGAIAGKKDLPNAVFRNLQNLTFIGSNNKAFTFDENHDAPAVYDIYGYDIASMAGKGEEREKWKLIGVYESGEFKWERAPFEKTGMNGSSCSKPCGKNEAKISEEQVCCWNCQKCQELEYVANGTACEKCPEGQRPNNAGDQCESMEVQEMSYNSIHGTIILIISGTGVILTLIILSLYIAHRNSPIVKASGRELCFFVLLGVIVTFSNSFAMAASASTASCAAARIILSLGPTCMYGSLLIKTARVVIIFRSKILSPQVKLFLRPSWQIGASCAILALQVFILVIWFSMEPASATRFLSGTHAFRACKNLVKLQILIGLVYPFLLIVICTVLATINRNVPTGFNEAQLIGFTMYTTCVIWLAFIPIFVTNEDSYPQKIMVVSICMSSSAATVLVCLFVPRCYKILFHPEENTSQSVMSTGPSASTNTQQKRV